MPTKIVKKALKPPKVVKKLCKTPPIPPEILPQPIQPLKHLTLPDFRQQCLDEHNRLRALHCCPPLTFCKELNHMALQWAIHLARKNRVEARHFDNNGENIYVAENVNVTGDIPAQRWYSEIDHYEFANSKFTPCVAHFTQLIWKKTKKLGVGVARFEDNTYVVAFYFPPGNIVGHFKENVPRRSQ